MKLTLAIILALCCSVDLFAADTVTPVDLGSYDCVRLPPSSSLIGNVCYDTGKRSMLVEISGSYQQYCGVGVGTVVRLAISDTPVGFYSQNIKRQFSCNSVAAND